MARIHLSAGDLVGAYRNALVGAQGGDPEAIELIIEICERASDLDRACKWRAELSALNCRQ